MSENNIKSTPYTEVRLSAPDYFFIPKNFEEKNEYDKGFQITELFLESSLGVLSKNDSVTIEFEKSSLNASFSLRNL